VRVPLSWLSEFVKWSGPVGGLADRLTMAGLAVDDVAEVGRLDARVIAGKLVEVARHPEADRLQVCAVDVGKKAAITVVSAAPGLAAGQLVPVALPGARLADGNETRATELRGVASGGVLCSEAELGLGDDTGGVLVLSDDATPGTPLVELAGLADTVLEIDVTPNRGDCLSIFGIAREVAAITGTRLRHPRPRLREQGAPASDAVRLKIEARDLCPRYAARVVREVRIERSPLALRLRLRRAGMRTVNAIVDVTNHVMLERGQPLHAFDFDRLEGGRIVVRRAKAGEKLVTLDGVERTLAGEELVIADARAPIALAGVMGGQASEVTDATRTLLLESAWFLPAAVRRTARRSAIASQAAYRFERRVDPAMVDEALDCAAAMVARLAGGRIAPGAVSEPAKGWAPEPPAIRLRPRRVAGLLGVGVPRGEIVRRLHAIGMTCRQDGETVVAKPPSHRGDLRSEEDLIEEVARLGGYDAIPSALPEAPVVAGEDSRARLAIRRLRRLCVAEGLTEMVTLAFTDAETNRLLPGYLGRTLTPLDVKNPLSSETGQLRRSPLGGLLRATRSNVGLGAAFVGAFEIGKGYGLDADGQRREPRTLAIVLHGVWPARGAEREGPPVDFADLKGVVESLLADLGVDGPALRWAADPDVSFLHPGKAARVELAGTSLGVLGALHPKVAQACDLAGEVWLSELDFTELAHYGSRRLELRPIPRFPAVTRDIAVIVDDAFQAATILEEILALADPRIETIAYRAPDRTLTDTEVAAIHGDVVGRIRSRFPLEVRA
jgi:phenylalanyl-tRNA synthetase beta chain